MKVYILRLRVLGLLTFTTIITITGCGPSPSDSEKMRQTLIQNAITQIPSVKEFHRLWPMAGKDVSSHQFQKGTTKIQLRDIVYDRYELTLTIAVDVDPKTLAIKSYDPPLITLLETKSITVDGGRINRVHGAYFQISQEQWRNLVQTEGQFPAAGIQVTTNEPVAGIAELKASIRAHK